ncbi:hypothetical protein DLD77_00830 [Chitinophaga alhagiae]|uniref:YhcH/YjgK/YiaL family protein n=1 Tax=Chitinophaga alhagiae TaxID=2203219 RepID=A0ABM6W8T4_9BACT|nr:YhcH/YjgK/YiaL family protein [Chitinophaga alhagiae]AWO00351.1 hypothetical protein DLD77_00830 [Chitinophaga alhagiae]
MIFDYVENYTRYAKGNTAVWEKVFDFIAGLNENSAAGKFDIIGDDVFAFVQHYETLPVEAGKIEAHDQYLDIHVPLSGSERVYFSALEALVLLEDFRPASDDLLFAFDAAKASSFELTPRHFALFLPGEGHMTRIQTGPAPAAIKKAVIKISGNLFYGPK